ncbi:MAG: bifunctional salicylyl-CoA 5-hydroxylase/oxidoreductase [Myxococcales bacterium]|nr:bifunctional salicylyl-CoA 5-hydroxylase/oxidoreductase [Myxococcales bacterium]
MKVHVLGGGPAGLYFSILLAKARPHDEIVVFERNRPDDTFGFGVVFSDETLGNLGDADAESYAAIRERMAYWDAIDVHLWAPEARTMRSRGHGFCGLGRQALLDLLQARALSLGVTIRFEEEVVDVEALRAQCDLLVAADGINSATRARYEDAFAPRMEHGSARYVWLGTPRTFEAFTFSFREDAAGVWQVHAYSFDDRTSTFIVECDDETFAASGLAEDDEVATIAHCEKLFAEELAGAPLVANRSRWLRFRTLHCERWHHDNVVLLGDAAHTAHFSVGSGTKMAMEDAIDLAAAITAQGDAPTIDVPRALATYEETRRPMISRVQRSAEQSQRFFEETKRHLRQPPEVFNFALLTRSNRITHENLRLRDAPYVESVDRWFAERSGVPAGPDAAPPPMFTPFTLRGLTLPNRVVVSPMCQYSAVDGVPNDWHLVHLGSRALGGAGLVIAEMTDVCAEGRISPGCTGLWSDAQEAAWRRIVEFVHEQAGGKIGMQIAHAGRKGATKRPWEGSDDEPLDEGAWPLIGPSPIAWAERNQVPREMTRADMVSVRDAFVASARRAARCGFDLLEVHAAHGYLLSSFLTPLSNQRGDEYGGSLENRARFPLEVVEAVRAVWDGPLSVRISATDWVPGGFDVEDAVVLAGWLKERGVDLLDVSAGQTSTEAKPVYGRAFQSPFAERIRVEVGVPTLSVGNIWDHDRVNTLLLSGRADLVALARAHLADPYFTAHAAASLGVPARWSPQYRAAASIAGKMFGPE